MTRATTTTATSTAAAKPARPPRPRTLAPGQDPVDAAIDQACRTLHLPTIRDSYDELAQAAMGNHASYKEFLADLLAAESAHRDQRRKLRLVREANFPRPKRVEDFDFTANPASHPKWSTPSPTPPGWPPATRSA